MAFDSAYGLPDIYFLAAVLGSTLDGLWSEKPRDVGKIVPFFADASSRQSVSEMAARFAAVASRGKPS